MNKSELKEELLETLLHGKSGMEVSQAFRKLEALGWFEDGTLEGTDFSGVDLSMSVWVDFVLHKSKFDNTQLFEVVFQNMDLQEATFIGADLTSILMTDCNCQNCVFDDAYSDALFRFQLDGNFQGASFKRVKLQGGLFTGSFKNTDFTGANLRNTILTQDFQNTSLQDADLQETEFWGLDLRGADLTNATLKNVKLVESREVEVMFDKKTVLPDGTHWMTDTDLQQFIDPKHPNFRSPSNH